MRSTLPKTLLLGCGSNVVDYISHVIDFPNIGDKNYIIKKNNSNSVNEVVGGVTLNHLAWASTLGVPTGLLALQGKDKDGRLIRRKMKEYGISQDFLTIKSEFTTSKSYVFVDRNGERTIIMSPECTSEIDADTVVNQFSKSLKKATFVSTEISQIPLTGVEAILDNSKKFGKLSFLDFDVSPSVVPEANLGDLSCLLRCVSKSDIIKITRSSAMDLLKMVSKPKIRYFKLEHLASELLCNLPARAIIITDGSKGSAIAVSFRSNLPHEPLSLFIPPIENVMNADSTGAGDAYFGGIISGFYHWGIPKNEREIRRIGKLASTAGATCCEILGGFPDKSVITRMKSMNHDVCSILKEPAIESPWITKHSVIADIEALKELLVAMEYQKTSFDKAVDGILNTRDSGNSIYVSGIGKSGIVGQRLASSLSSISIPTNWIHASEWLHGDFGKLRNEDLVILLSHSGESPELTLLPKHLKLRGANILSIVGRSSSSLSRTSDMVLVAPAEFELSEKIPTRSIVVQDALINALLHCLHEKIEFSLENFMKNHPGGAIGLCN